MGGVNGRARTDTSTSMPRVRPRAVSECRSTAPEATRAGTPRPVTVSSPSPSSIRSACLITLRSTRNSSARAAWVGTGSPARNTPSRMRVRRTPATRSAAGRPPPPFVAVRSRVMAQSYNCASAQRSCPRPGHGGGSGDRVCGTAARQGTPGLVAGGTGSPGAR